MNLEFNATQDILLTKVKGEMDLATAEPIRQAIDKRLQLERSRCLLLDLSGVSFIDSSGLGVILGRYQYLQRLGGRMALLKPAAGVKRVLEMAGIDRLMPVCESEGEAIKHLTRLR